MGGRGCAGVEEEDWMAALYEYGLTPASMTAVALAIVTLSLAMWGAHWWRAARNRRLP